MRRILISLFILITFTDFASAKKIDFCREYGLGWNFYCHDEKKEEEKTERNIPIKTQEDYKDQLTKIKQTLEDKKAKAVIYPTEENIKDYMAYQKMVLNRSGTFADQWRRVIWKTPELDYTLKRPVSKAGKEAWIDKRNQDIESVVRTINERYGVFFVFRSDCPYCHRYAPILKSFQNKYGITIMPISIDGGVIPGWENAVINKGQIEKMGVEITAVPTTLLFDKETKKVIQIGSGVLSHSELEERIYATTKLEVGDDF